MRTKIILILLLSILLISASLPEPYVIFDLINLQISPPTGAYIEVPPIIPDGNQVIVTSANSYKCTIVYPSAQRSGTHLRVFNIN